MADPATTADASALSFAEELLWRAERSGGEAPAFLECPLTLSLVVRIQGRLDVAALHGGLEDVARRHAVLRSRFSEQAGRPRRVLASDASAPLEQVDLRGRPDDEREQQARRLLGAHVERTFDLAREPPWRASLLRLRDDEHLLALAIHHIAFDGASRAVLAGELEAHYGARAGLDGGVAPPLAAGYLDYVAWQRARLHGGALARLLAAWRARLGTAPELRLAGDGPHPVAPAERAGVLRFDLRGERVAGLRLLARQHSATPAVALLALLTLLLRRLSGARDLVIGMPVSDRRRREFEDLIGLFTNVLLVRATVGERPSFIDLLRGARQGLQAAVAEQELPYACFAREWAGEAAPFRVAFNFMSRPAEPRLRLPGLDTQALEIGRQHPAATDLSLHVLDRRDVLACQFVYRADRFSRAWVEGAAELFTLLAGRVASQPGRTLDDVL